MSSSLTRAKALIYSCLLFLVALSTQTRAHIVEQFYADYHKGSGELILNFDVSYAIPEIRDIAEAPQPTRNWLLEQNDEQHHLLRKEAALYIDQYLLFQIDGIPVNYKILFPDFEEKPYPFIELLNQGAYYTIKLIPNIPENTSGKLSIKVKPEKAPNLLIAFKTNNQATFKTINPQMTEQLDQLTSSIVPASTDTPAFSTFELLILGFRHVIPDGLDHVLFIIGICLLAQSLRQLLWQSLVFTIAHAFSMALVISQVIPVYSSQVSSYIESLIAISIAFIALEGLWLQTGTKRRFILIAIFGLIHGLGFAGSLGSSLQFLSADHWITPLIFANLGIEIAQAALVLTTFTLLIYLKRTLSIHYNKNLRLTIALSIACFGIIWFFQRLP